MDEAKKVDELRQKPFPWRRQTVTLYEDRIELAAQIPGDRHRIPFYLHMLKEEPDRVTVIPWLWLFLALAGFSGAVAFLMTGDPLLSALLGGMGLAILAVQIPRMRPRLVYAYRPMGPEGPKTRYEPHLYLVPDQPSRDAVRAFVEKVRAVQKRHVERLKSEQEGEGGVGYVRELERFAQLRERNVLTEGEFTEVKARLLNLRPRRIGF